jgi:hypothetical protein
MGTEKTYIMLVLENGFIICCTTHSWITWLYKHHLLTLSLWVYFVRWILTQNHITPCSE